MTQPTHGLDPNALEAAQSAGEDAYVKAYNEAPEGSGVAIAEQDGIYAAVETGIRDYLAALSQNPGTSNTSGQAAAVKVKPLQWEDVTDKLWDANALGTFYRIKDTGGRRFVLALNGFGFLNDHKSLDEAKAAAQADYEVRILAALEPRASDREAVTLEDLRTQGWSVAVHNDYRLSGKQMTFWLFTHPSGRWVKGEGETDTAAVDECRAAIRKLSEVSHEH